MSNLIQDNLALDDRLDKQGSYLYNLENLNIPQKVSKAVDEIVTDAAHEVYNSLFEALLKSLERDYSNKLLVDLDEACKKKRKNRVPPRTPFRSPPLQPPPAPPPVGASGAPGTSGASGSSQLPLSPPPPSTGTSGYAQQ
ncbi:hypothetical protein Tco_0022581 [Tanacetum coccineum]